MSSIFETMIKLESLAEETPCFNCDKYPGLIRCHQCGDNWPICFKCDRKAHHDMAFHDRQAWLKNNYWPIQPKQSLDEIGQLIDVGMSIPKVTCPTYVTVM